MQVVLYKNSSPPNVVSKKLSGSHNIDATFFRENYLDVMNPTITAKLSSSVADLVKYNYVYISDLKRYYFIDSISAEAGLAIIKCRVDVLMSFKDDIYASKQYVNRQQSTNTSPYLLDDLMPIQSKHNYLVKPFGNNVDDRSCGRVILATTGKGGTIV